MTLKAHPFTTRLCLVRMWSYISKVIVVCIRPAFETTEILLGSAVYVYGSANCSYMVTLDSTPVAGTLNQSSVGLLFAQEGLQSTTHTVNLTLLSTNTADSMLGLDQITFTNTINQKYDLFPTVIPPYMSNI